MLPNVVLFEGVDSHGDYELWETNGTATGTFEVTGVTGTSPTGLYPNNLARFTADQALFSGAGPSGLSGLWVTDGTASGTHQLSVAGADRAGAGLFPSDFTIYNGKALFSGYDASGNVGLWVTDGTAAGTHELTNIAGAQTTVIGSLPGLAPSNLTV